MNIKLNGDTTTKELREAFTDTYDGIKIEFFRHSHEHEEGSPKKDMVREVLKLRDLNSEVPSMLLSVDENMTVNQVEDIFEERLGLHVQVFRKMNMSWIETTATDSYTLKEQVELSRESRGLSN